MSTEIERIAEEVDACNLPYSMELVRLVDGVSTYELRINGEVREFGDLDDLYEHVRVAKANAKAEVITKFVATARTEARKAALEEAAKLAETPGVWKPHPDIPDCFRIATAIRSLIGTDPATDREEG